MTLNELKQNIKAAAENVTGIGKVYDRFVYAFDEKQLKELFVSNDKVNVLMFRNTEREPDCGEGLESELFVKRLWKFRLICGYNYDDNSENSFNNLCESICQIFNSDSAVNIRRSSFMKVTDKYDSEYHGVLVHNAEMEMETA